VVLRIALMYLFYQVFVNMGMFGAIVFTFLQPLSVQPHRSDFYSMSYQSFQYFVIFFYKKGGKKLQRVAYTTIVQWYMTQTQLRTTAIMHFQQHCLVRPAAFKYRILYPNVSASQMQ